MTKKDIFVSFEHISVSVGQHQSTSKVLQEDKAVIEVTSKEIFIGKNGNYRIKWKDVTQLDINDDVVDNDEGFTIQATKHRVVASNPTDPKQWKALSKQFEKIWNKRLEKEKRREQKEKQMERSTVRQPRVYKSNYSKRKNRYTSFLEKNENANVWDSEDDETFNHQRPKRSKIEELEQQVVNLQPDAEEKEHEDETMVDEEPIETTTTVEEDHDLFMGDETAKDEDQEEPHDDPQPLAEDDDDEEQDSPPTAEQVRSASKSKKTKRRLFQKKRRLFEDEDSDDDLFNDDNKKILTTPHKAQRVVSPALSTAGPNRFAEDIDEDEDQDDTQGKQKEEQETEEDNAGLQNISKFFQPKGKLTKPSKTTKSKKTVTPRSKTPTRKPLNEEESSPSKEAKSSRASDFFRFGGKKAVKMPATSQSVDSPSKGSDVSTVVPTPTSTQQTEGGNIADESIISTPPRPIQKRTNFFSGRKSSTKKTMVEEDDPIVDSPISPSNSNMLTPSKAFFSSQKRRSMHSKSTASMALEFADVHSPTKRSPVQEIIQGRPGILSQRRNRLRKAIVTPVAPPSLPKWRGLRNLGNSCYMNASLQMLYSVPNFIEALQGSKDDRSLVAGVCELWRQLQISAPTAASPKFVKASVDSKTDKFRGFHQRDAHEFLGHLIDQMHEELESPPVEEIVDPGSPFDPKKGEEKPATESSAGSEVQDDAFATDRFFRLNVEVCLECKSCGYSRTKEEMYRYLSIDIDHGDVQDGDTKRAVDKCLESFFQPEDREIKCEKCDYGRTATQTMRILSRPTSLLLHLKRFVIVEKAPSDNNDTENNEFEITFRKNKAPVQLNESLSLESFMADSSEHAETSYKLQSIVHHLGSTAESGHYTADSARLDNENDNKETWVSYDDGDASETSLGTIQKSVENQRTAYMLLYNLEA